MAAYSVSGLCRFSLVCAAALFALACGGKNEPEAEPSGRVPSAGLPLNPCLSELEELGYEFATGEPFESDFERGVASSFYADNDGTEGATMTPDPDRPLTVAELAEPRCPDDPEPSTVAFRLHATGLRDWGAVVGKSFHPPNSFDGADWDGLSLWVRRGPNSGTTMFAAINEYHTNETCGVCGASEIVEETCDRFGVGIGLNEDWRFIAIPFSSMKQQGYGKPADCLNQRAILGFQFLVSSGDWDVWVDDIRFYRGPEGDRPPAANVCDEEPLRVCEPEEE